MKRNLMSSFLVFIATLFVFSLAGCEVTGDETDTTTEANTTTEEDTTTEEGTTTADDTESTTGDEVIVVEPIEGEVPLDDSLVSALRDYLKNLFTEYDLLASDSFEDKLTSIKQGKLPIHVVLDSSNYYYACAYYMENPEQHPESSCLFYCCVDDYIWVGFENEQQIPDSYQGNEFVVAFQINLTSLCQNILEEENSNITSEHFQIYETEFTDGFNTAPPLSVSDAYVYLASAKQNPLYFCNRHTLHKYSSFSCIQLDGQWYIPMRIATEYADGDLHEVSLASNFGVYYDDLTSIMITGQYSTTAENGNTYHYGLFKLEDIANLMKK
ncbi:MAG: hypothetical protein IJW92_09205 [Clostridia bacterium]|nr:hypothetical protein [Clostridia bacterium]